MLDDFKPHDSKPGDFKIEAIKPGLFQAGRMNPGGGGDPAKRGLAPAPLAGRRAAANFIPGPARFELTRNRPTK